MPLQYAVLFSLENNTAAFCSVVISSVQKLTFNFYSLILKIVAKGMVSRGNGGAIVNISSQASQAALKDHTVYCKCNDLIIY